MRRSAQFHRCLPFAFLAATLAIVGCEEAPTAALLDVTSVGPARIDPGHRLVVSGAGFAVGHDVRIALIGVLARPFEDDEPLDETFDAEAVDEEHVEMLVSETLLRERFGRATFRGRVEVRFDARWGDDREGTISGAVDDQQIDFVPAHAAAGEGTALDEALGVHFADVADEGLEVAEVEPDRRGAELGLFPGDALVEVGDAHILPGDSPRVPEGAEATTLTVVREGRSVVLRAQLDEHTSSDARDEATLRLTQLALLIVLAALLSAWPFSAVDVGATRPARALTRPTLAMIVRALAGLLLAHLALRTIDHLPPVGLVIASIVGLRAATILAGSPRPTAQLPAILISSICLAVALAALPSVLDVSDVALLARGGSAMPLDWPVLREPVGVLGLVLLALAIGSARPVKPLARTIDDVCLLAVAVVFVLAGTGLSPVGRVGLLATDVAVVGVAWLLGRAREHVRPSPAILGVALGLSVLIVLLASAWIVADPGAPLRRALAEVSLGAVVLTLLFALRAATRERPPARAQHALL